MATTISNAAINLIVGFEVSSPSYYTKFCSGFIWSGGGPTVGIGYDCGYVSRTQIATDWVGIIDGHRIWAIDQGSGLLGATAQVWVAAHKNSVTITYAEAYQEFHTRELPKWILIVQQHLANTALLTPDQLGALVSLTYNRGPSFNAAGDRYTEMRAIKADMANKNFADIPAQFRSMERLWPTVPGLRTRREQEAELFERGL